MIKNFVRHRVKKILKNNRFIFAVIANAILLYLRFVSLTSKWQYIWHEGYSADNFQQRQPVIFAFWHDKIAFGALFFSGYRGKDLAALASPHSDGQVIGKIIDLLKKEVIWGSTNKEATSAIREIIKKLRNNYKIVITPDGPRGPRHQVGGAITRIAEKYDTMLIPVGFAASKYFQLGSWDRMIIPKPFGKITVAIGEEINLTNNESQDKLVLKQKLDLLTQRAEVKNAGGKDNLGAQKGVQG